MVYTYIPAIDMFIIIPEVGMFFLHVTKARGQPTRRVTPTPS